ncbi:hypothetical protein L1887_26651 [Cichorium endivia]|nr:hypothetical protein L1887_26651 [Cichorium endivia]
MATRKTNHGSCIKIFSFAIGIAILLLTTQFGAVNCRSTLRATQLTSNRVAAGFEQIQEAESIGKTGLRVSSSDKKKGSSFRWRVKEMAPKLASGPSKRGPGH